MKRPLIEEQVRDYIADARHQVEVPQLLELRILRALEAGEPKRRSHRFGFLRLAAAMAALVVIASGVGLMRLMTGPAGATVGNWSKAASMAQGRGYQTATLLPNGKVLVVGGVQPQAVLSSAELYDPATRIWTSAGALKTPRLGHTATLLKNGKVLVVGGSDSIPDFIDALSSAELYDPRTDTWSPAGSMRAARAYHTATLLADGRVLVVGGFSSTSASHALGLTSAELYDPATNTWNEAAPLSAPRAMHAAVLLGDNRVLIMGGSAIRPAKTTSVSITRLRTATLYDPVTDSWSPAPDMHYARTFPTATPLPDGRVLVVGDDGVNERTAELYNPASEQWAPAPDSQAGRATHVAVRLTNGDVLVAGGLAESSASVFDWRRDAWIPAGEMAKPRSNATATLLPGGEVLVAGGYGNLATPWASTEVYDHNGLHPVDGTHAAPAPLPTWLVTAIAAAFLVVGVAWTLRRRPGSWPRAGDGWIDSQR